MHLFASMQPRRVLLFALAIPLGVFISVALQVRPAAPSGGDSAIRSVSAETILRLEDEQQSLKDSIKVLREQVIAAQRDAAVQRTQLAGTSQELDQLKRAAGLTLMQGPGVRVTLDDSSMRVAPPGTDANTLLVHDFDLRDVVAVLWSNGAQAIDINGQRLVETTSIYCVGSTILVNDTRLSPPYVIDAIGPATMQQTIDRPEVLTQFKTLVHQYGLGLRSDAMSTLTVPPFDGRMSVRYASPVGH